LTFCTFPRKCTIFKVDPANFCKGIQFTKEYTMNFKEIIPTLIPLRLYHKNYENHPIFKDPGLPKYIANLRRKDYDRDHMLFINMIFGKALEDVVQIIKNSPRHKFIIDELLDHSCSYRLIPLLDPKVICYIDYRIIMQYPKDIEYMAKWYSIDKMTRLFEKYSGYNMEPRYYKTIIKAAIEKEHYDWQRFIKEGTKIVYYGSVSVVTRQYLDFIKKYIILKDNFISTKAISQLSDNLGLMKEYIIYCVANDIHIDIPFLFDELLTIPVSKIYFELAGYHYLKSTTNKSDMIIFKRKFINREDDEQTKLFFRKHGFYMVKSITMPDSYKTLEDLYNGVNPNYKGYHAINYREAEEYDWANTNYSKTSY
jgi:hypothetical protein